MPGMIIPKTNVKNKDLILNERSKINKIRDKIGNIEYWGFSKFL
jgi:hypothetical protein